MFKRRHTTSRPHAFQGRIAKQAKWANRLSEQSCERLNCVAWRVFFVFHAKSDKWRDLQRVSRIISKIESNQTSFSYVERPNLSTFCLSYYKQRFPTKVNDTRQTKKTRVELIVRKEISCDEGLTNISANTASHNSLRPTTCVWQFSLPRDIHECSDWLNHSKVFLGR